MFKSALPAFVALREFEWIGYPELRADMVQAVLQAHPHLQTLGLIGWHFDAVGVVRITIVQSTSVTFTEMGVGYSPPSAVSANSSCAQRTTTAKPTSPSSAPSSTLTRKH